MKLQHIQIYLRSEEHTSEQIKTLSYMIDLYEKQEANNLCNSNMTLLTKEIDEESVAADSSLSRTGTDNLGK